jgi:hypothetical protein
METASGTWMPNRNANYRQRMFAEMRLKLQSFFTGVKSRVGNPRELITWSPSIIINKLTPDTKKGIQNTSLCQKKEIKAKKSTSFSIL